MEISQVIENQALTDILLNKPELKKVVLGKFNMFKNTFSNAEKDKMMWETLSQSEALKYFFIEKILPKIESLLTDKENLLDQNKNLNINLEELKNIIEKSNVQLNEENMEVFRNMSKEIIYQNNIKKTEKLERSVLVVTDMMNELLDECRRYSK